MAQIAQTLTKDHAQAAKAVRLPLGTAEASASPYFSLQDLLKKWPKDSDARQVLMITDGVDPYWDSFGLNDPYVDAAIADCQRAGVVVYSIYTRAPGHFGHSLYRINQAQSLLSETTDATGGESYYLGNANPVSFTPYLTEIRERQNHQFILSFMAQPGKKAGLQRIRLSTEIPNAELVAQHSVYVAGE
jgi:transposase